PPSSSPPPPCCLLAQLCLEQADGSLAEQFRKVGTNKIEMLAWHVVMRTPEYPEGREMVVIVSGVTFQSGSF
ncbi:unnamed protein product, partial [Laminaria digitata]